MARFKYFADIDGQTFELSNVWHDGAVATTATHFFGRTDDGRKVQATRKIQYKSNPSRHECNARCTHAKGRTMNCECSCGGANHGKYA